MRKWRPSLADCGEPRKQITPSYGGQAPSFARGDRVPAFAKAAAGRREDSVKERGDAERRMRQACRQDACGTKKQLSLIHI